MTQNDSRAASELPSADFADTPDTTPGSDFFRRESARETLAGHIADYALERPRAAHILRLRLGLDTDAPVTLTHMGVQCDVSRDRVRQLHTQAMAELLRRMHAAGALPLGEFAELYPTTAKDHTLVRALLQATYTQETDLAATEWSYLELRLAGHSALDARRIAGYVTQQLIAWHKRMNHLLRHPYEQQRFPAGALTPWLAQVDWPSAMGGGAPLPVTAARTIDAADPGRGRFYLDKVGRNVSFDSGVQARLMGIVNAHERVRTLIEAPEAVLVPGVDGERIHFPTLAASLTDGRIVVIESQPLGTLACRSRQETARAVRDWAHSLGWGFGVWTGSAIGVADLRHRAIPPEHTTPWTELVQQGTAPVRAIRRLWADTDPLDFAALVLRNEWIWDRAPLRLSAAPAPRSGM